MLVPKENEKDLKEVPEEITKSLDIRLVEHVDEVLELALCAKKEEIFLQNKKAMPLHQKIKYSEESSEKKQ